MKHIEEHILERYLRRPDTLDVDDTALIGDHLRSCEICMNSLEFLRSFYSELDGITYVRTPKANTFLDSIIPPAAVIPLRPVAFKPGANSVDSRFTTVLAADTATHHRFSSFLTLHSEEEDIVVRILWERERDTYRLYVLSNDVRKREYAVVSFPAFSVECVTDKNGYVEFKLPSGLSSREVDSMQAVLHVPFERIDFVGSEVADQKGTTRTTAATQTLNVRYGDGILYLQVKSDAEKTITRALMTDRKERSFLMLLQNGTGRCSIDSVPEEFTIRLYS